MRDWLIRRKWALIILVALALISIPFQYDIEIPFLKKESFSSPEATVLIEQLLKNTYRAFDFREESDIYDKLAISNEGELLSEIYLQTKKSMLIENQGGIRAKVKSVQVVDVQEIDVNETGRAYNCHWLVSGTVGHWGHIHSRTNKYLAVINILPVDGVWKMVGLDMIEETRL